MIKAKINVLKVDKTKFFKGEKGTYLDIVLIETPNGQYGDYMVVQDTTKEERAAGKQGAILGNATYFAPKQGGPRGQGRRPAPTARPAAPPPADDDERAW